MARPSWALRATHEGGSPPGWTDSPSCTASSSPAPRHCPAPPTPLQPPLQVLYSGKMLESPNYVASREQGELVPSMTLNKFETKEEEWSWTERMTILAKSVLLTAFDNMNPALWR